VNFLERLIVKSFLSHLLSHFPAHLAWIFPVVVFATPSLRAWEAAHRGALSSQIIGILLAVVARYVSPKATAKAAIALALLFAPFAAYAQTPTPSSSTMSFQVGAGAFGLFGGSSTPATDLTASINPGFKKAPGFSLATDSFLAPGVDFQFYGAGPGYTWTHPFPSTSAFAPISITVRGSIGADRIVPATGAGQSNISFLAPLVSVDWHPSPSISTNLLQVGLLHAPGFPGGPNVPVVGGSVTLFFGKGQ
jgi:hypothetical protein